MKKFYYPYNLFLYMNIVPSDHVVKILPKLIDEELNIVEYSALEWYFKCDMGFEDISLLLNKDAEAIIRQATDKIHRRILWLKRQKTKGPG